MRCIVVDDNKIALMAIKKLVSMVNHLELVAECSSAKEVIPILETTQIDLVFLDVEMPELSGLDLIRQLQKRGPEIILTTSSKNHAVEAFELNVIDYLVKPIRLSRFMKAVERAREVLCRQGIETNNGFLSIRENGKIRAVQVAEILFIEATRDYVTVHTMKGSYLTLARLKWFIASVPSSGFIQVHRSFIVAIDKIDFLKDNQIFIGGRAIPIGEGFKKKLLSLLGPL